MIKSIFEILKEQNRLLFSHIICIFVFTFIYYKIVQQHGTRKDKENFNKVLRVSNAQTKKDLTTIRNLVKPKKPTQQDVWDYKNKYIANVETSVAKRLPKGAFGKRTPKQMTAKMKMGEKAVTNAFIRKVKINLERAATVGTVAIPAISATILLAGTEDKK